MAERYEVLNGVDAPRALSPQLRARLEAQLTGDVLAAALASAASPRAVPAAVRARLLAILAVPPWWRRPAVLAPAAAALALVLAAVVLVPGDGPRRPLAGGRPAVTESSAPAQPPGAAPDLLPRSPSPTRASATPRPSGVVPGPRTSLVPGVGPGDGSGAPAPAGPAGAEAGAAVRSVSPTEGPMRGGTKITLSGRGLASVVRVEVGGRAASDVRVVSDAMVTAVTPARHRTGWVDVVAVLSSGERYGVSPGFAYLPQPRVTRLDPERGPVMGGNTVTITGSGFHERSAVSFGDTRATTVEVVSPTTIRVTAPAHLPGEVEVVVTTAGGASAPVRYTYAA